VLTSRFTSGKTAKEDNMLAIKTILHPTDFSERSTYAFRLACTLARDHGGRVVVLHVATVPTVVALEGVIVPDRPIDEEALQEKLAALRSEAPGVVVEHRLIVSSNPVDAIVHRADELRADLIIMGSHGRTGLRRALLGSVAELVLRRANCPVLTVKQPFAPVEVENDPAPAAKRPAVASLGR
jgi:nucleotide-binding universal stress UspA family protein